MAEYVFLLGGQDLEMLEIKKLLEQNNRPYYERGLNWKNASWKAYRNIIENNQDKEVVFVGIELRDKDKCPANSLDIDHHNYDRCKPASIEQIAELLDLKLTPWQQKIAVNDKSYITGLLKNRLPFSEIEEIRQKDREAQGLSVKDCVKARQLLEKQPPVIDEKSGLTIWEVPDDWKSFVPLSDAYFLKLIEDCLQDGASTEDCVRKLEKEKLIIFNKNKFNYSGYIPAEILEKYEDEINRGEAYFGGAEKSGYFGFVNDYVIKKGAKKILTEWQDIMKKTKSNTEIVQKKEMYSYHVFLFPFRWDIEGKNSRNFKEKINLSDFDELLSDKWLKEPYNPGERPEYYNEYTYFYDFVRDVIFDRTEIKQDNNKILNHYTYQLPENAEYVIKIKSSCIYKLKIDDIYLHVFSTGIGILSFNLQNVYYPRFQDILNINEFGRRIYPQFLTGNKNLTIGAKQTFLADYIEISGINNSKENFSFYNDISKQNQNFFVLPHFISVLLGENFIGVKSNNTSKELVSIRPVVDDRMFVISWYGHDELSHELRKKEPVKEWHTFNQGLSGETVKGFNYNYLSNINWYKYIFIDTGEPMLQNDEEIETVLRKHTYARFANSGTFYGITRYSFVLLTNRSWFAKNILRTHLKTMYYQIIVLSLMQRASILRFSDEVTEISKCLNEKEQSERIKILNKEYLKFINTMYFREVTAQEQGIELYDMINQHMRIERDVKDLNREIDELYQLDSMLSNEKLNNEAHKVTKIGVYFAVASILTGLLGMNIMPEQKDVPKFLFGKPYWAFWIGSVLIALLTFIIGSFILSLLKNKK